MIAENDNAPLREVSIPSRRLKAGNYKFPACVRLVHVVLRSSNNIETPFNRNNKTRQSSARCAIQTLGSLLNHNRNPNLNLLCFRKVRACFENSSAKGLRARRGGWRGATRAHIREKSVTEDQRSQPPRPAARPPEIFSKHALRLGARCAPSRAINS